MDVYFHIVFWKAKNHLKQVDIFFYKTEEVILNFANLLMWCFKMRIKTCW